MFWATKVTLATRYFLLLSPDLGFLSPDLYAQLEAHYTQTSRTLNAFLRSLSPR